MKPGHGRVDYLLYVDKKALGVIEAKPVGTTLAGVEWQSAMYAGGLPEDVLRRAIVVHERLPFVVEPTGSEWQFTNGYDPDPRARRVFAIPTPSHLAQIIRDAAEDPAHPTWRSKARHLPALDTRALRPAQIDVIEVEAGIEAHPGSER